MKLDRMFIELHDGDDLVLIDVDAIHAIVGEANSHVYFTGCDGYLVDESPRDIVERIHEAYVKAATARRGAGLAGEAVSDFDRALGYPKRGS